MPKSTNSNAPSKEYKDASVDKGAAFRASITFEDALNKLVHATYKGRLENLRGKSSKNLPKPRSAFHSDPWPAYASSKNGKEYDLDGGIVWRAIRHSGYWFLAKHAGAFNGFEFWHIRDWGQPAPALAGLNAPVVQTPPNTPTVAPMNLVPSITNQQTYIPALTPAPSPTTPTPSLPTLNVDDWEAITDDMLSGLHAT